MLVAGYYGVDLTGMLTGEPMPQQQTSTQRSISLKDDEAAKLTSVNSGYHRRYLGADL